MPETVGRMPPALWRAVIRPLAEEVGGEVVCDAQDPGVVERLLALTATKVHLVASANALRELAPAYGDRIAGHETVAAAWDAADDCRLAILDARRSLREHVEVVRRLVNERELSAAIVVYGLEAAAATSPGDPSVSVFGEHGWSVLEVPGHDRVRLVLPVRDGRVDDATRGVIDQIHSNRLEPEVVDEPVDEPADEATVQHDLVLRARIRELERLVAEADARRETAERRQSTADDTIFALRTFHEHARADASNWRERAKMAERQIQGALSQAEAAERRAAAAQADATASRQGRDALRLERDHLLEQVDELKSLHRTTREELVRVRESQSWRLGHALTRIGRILAFRKPGSTDALARAVERLDRAQALDEGES